MIDLKKKKCPRLAGKNIFMSDFCLQRPYPQLALTSQLHFLCPSQSLEEPAWDAQWHAETYNLTNQPLGPQGLGVQNNAKVLTSHKSDINAISFFSFILY